jgi:hypothetical protein
MNPISFTNLFLVISLPVLGGFLVGFFLWRPLTSQRASVGPFGTAIFSFAAAIVSFFFLLLPPLLDGALSCRRPSRCGQAFVDLAGVAHDRSEHLIFVGNSPFPFWMGISLRALIVAAFVAGAVSFWRRAIDSQD